MDAEYAPSLKSKDCFFRVTFVWRRKWYFEIILKKFPKEIPNSEPNESDVEKTIFVFLGSVFWHTNKKANPIQGDWACAGFDRGDGIHYAVIKRSGTKDIGRVLLSESNVGSPGKWVFRIDGLGIQSAGCEPNANDDLYGDHSLRVCDKVGEMKGESEKDKQVNFDLDKHDTNSRVDLMPKAEEHSNSGNGGISGVQYGDQIMPQKEIESRGKNR